jgi:hypothetical protein
VIEVRVANVNSVVFDIYRHGDAVRRGLMELGNTFLEKPYTVAAFSNAVHEALAKQYHQSETEGSNGPASG